MHFEAESQNNKYEVNVTETRHTWNVSLKKQDESWKHYEIPKNDFKSLDKTISFIFNNSSYLVDTKRDSDVDYNVYCRGSYRVVKIYNDEVLLHESLKAGGTFGGSDALNAGMPGKILKVFVKPGDVVSADEPLLIMEAMKMENEMRASSEVTIKSVEVKEGDTVDAGACLISFE
jgi:biotin carboxyl carrier protein